MKQIPSVLRECFTGILLPARNASAAVLIGEWLKPYRKMKGRDFEKREDAFNEKFRQLVEKRT